MTRVVLRKVRGGLVPADPASARFLALLRTGEGVAFDVRVARTVPFHRQFFKLLSLGFDTWDPAPAEGRPRQIKAFDSFRDSILILAGHCDVTYGADGSVRLEARSISFESCDEVVFRDLYKRVLDVLWEKVLRWRNYATPAQVDAVVLQMMEFE